MDPIRIFVASSSVYEHIARGWGESLQPELGAGALKELWLNKFSGSEMAIASAERVADDADFAVVLTTPTLHEQIIFMRRNHDSCL